ncbi:MAG: AraC family transcriptional regulator [Planctomycetia bacterium]|nr:AraC family transcriptional regulator [Planctomycetia bacterium]
MRAGIRRLLYEQTDTQPGGRALIVGLTLQLVASLARASTAPNVHRTEPTPNDANRRALERFVAELTHRFYEPVSIDRVAADLGMSRRSFTRLFRAVAGCSYADFVERVRIEYACRLLRETKRGIAPIAFECGYEELSSFYRAFKRHTRMAPGHWRETDRPIPMLREGGPIRQSD